MEVSMARHAHVVVGVVVSLHQTLKGILWWMVQIRWKVCISITPSDRQGDITMFLRQQTWMLILAEVHLEVVVDKEHLAGTVRLDNVLMVEDVAVEEGAEALRLTQLAPSEKTIGKFHVSDTLAKAIGLLSLLTQGQRHTRFLLRCNPTMEI